MNLINKYNKRFNSSLVLLGFQCPECRTFPSLKEWNKSTASSYHVEGMFYKVSLIPNNLTINDIFIVNDNIEYLALEDNDKDFFVVCPKCGCEHLYYKEIFPSLRKEVRELGYDI